MNKNEPLLCDQFFHIYNHANGKELLFFNDENYLYFLKLFGEYILPIADLYGYSLMSNQFHFLVKIKDEKSVFNYFRLEGKFPDEKEDLVSIKKLSSASGLDNLDVLSLHLSKQFSSFFNSYTKTINSQENRRGNLFVQAFKRELLEGENEIKQCIIDIHCKPVHQKFVNKANDWKYASYTAFLSDKPTKLRRDEVLDMFNGTENFIYCHNQKLELIAAEKTLD